MDQHTRTSDPPTKQAPRPHEAGKVWRSIALLLLSGIVVAAIEVGGVAVGVHGDFKTFWPLIPLAAIAGWTLAVLAVVQPFWPGTRHPVERLVGAALVMHVVAIMAKEPFASVRSEPAVIAATAWLAPLVAAGVVLPRSGCRLTGIGSWLILFAGTVAASYSAFHGHSGMGLLFFWVT